MDANIAVLSNSDLGAGPSSPGYGDNYYTDQYGQTHDYVNYKPAFDNNPNPPTYPLTFTSDSSQFTPPCFAEGSRVATLRGEVAVEDLHIGDCVLTAWGETRPVVWIGSRRVSCAAHPYPAQVNPVRIRQGAFGENKPHRDLVVSPGHAIYVDGVLIPALSLANGATIVQEAVERIRYFHIELDAHDVLVAEGLPCESYLDDGNRSTFANAGEFTALHGRLDPQSWDKACAPMVAGGPQLADVLRRLHERAEVLGWTRSEEPNLHVLADGVAIAPVVAKANRYWFAVPPCAELTLASNAAVLAYTLPGVVDPRRLGVAVSALNLDGHPVDLGGEAFGEGFHALETRAGHAWRWTDGQAKLRLNLHEPSIVEVALLLVAPTWKRAAPSLHLVHAG